MGERGREWEGKQEGLNEVLEFVTWSLSNQHVDAEKCTSTFDSL